MAAVTCNLVVPEDPAIVPGKVGIGLATLGGAVLIGGYLHLIRPWQLRWGATDEEAAYTMSGDEVVKHPTFHATRAVTIKARPEEICPGSVSNRPGVAQFEILSKE
jgi:hypothetical protein